MWKHYKASRIRKKSTKKEIRIIKAITWIYAKTKRESIQRKYNDPHPPTRKKKKEIDVRERSFGLLALMRTLNSWSILGLCSLICCSHQVNSIITANDQASFFLSRLFFLDFHGFFWCFSAFFFHHLFSLPEYRNYNVTQSTLKSTAMHGSLSLCH